MTVTSFKLTKAQVSFNCVGFSRLGVITQVRALTRASSRPRSSAAEAKRYLATPTRNVNGT